MQVIPSHSSSALSLRSLPILVLDSEFRGAPITISFINEISSSRSNEGRKFGAALISPDEECGPDRVPVPRHPAIGANIISSKSWPSVNAKVCDRNSFGLLRSSWHPLDNGCALRILARTWPIFGSGQIFYASVS
jgi:hypothetical protein